MSGRGRASALGGLLAAAIVLDACGSAGASVTVKDPWARPSMGADMPAAAYMTITNTGGSADALVSASSPQASMVSMHQTSMDASGMAGMPTIPRIDVPANGSVNLEPGGMHLMIEGLTAPLEVGQKLQLDLVFEHAGKVSIQAEVRGA